MHKLLDGFFSGKQTRVEVRQQYLTEFLRNVVRQAPSDKIFKSYFQGGLQYLNTLEPPEFNVLATEEKISFQIGDIQMVGVIDVVGEHDGLLIVDHKSRSLKERSGRVKQTKSDRLLDEYLRQLYCYAVAVEEKYGDFPKTLVFNCFRTGKVISEPFNKDAFKETKDWVTKSVEKIACEKDFDPQIDDFKCKYLCDMHDYCDFYEKDRR